MKSAIRPFSFCIDAVVIRPAASSYTCVCLKLDSCILMTFLEPHFEKVLQEKNDYGSHVEMHQLASNGGIHKLYHKNFGLILLFLVTLSLFLITKKPHRISLLKHFILLNMKKFIDLRKKTGRTAYFCKIFTLFHPLPPLQNPL